MLWRFLTVLAFSRHKKNIRRLLDGTESKIYLEKRTNERYKRGVLYGKNQCTWVQEAGELPWHYFFIIMDMR